MTGADIVRVTGSESYAAYMKFRTFQNVDSTWGFTILVNSRPYLHQKKIPVQKAERGFDTKEVAEFVAGLFIEMIRNGEASPQLNSKKIDSLGLFIK